MDISCKSFYFYLTHLCEKTCRVKVNFLLCWNFCNLHLDKINHASKITQVFSFNLLSKVFNISIPTFVHSHWLASELPYVVCINYFSVFRMWFFFFFQNSWVILFSHKSLACLLYKFVYFSTGFKSFWSIWIAGCYKEISNVSLALISIVPKEYQRRWILRISVRLLYYKAESRCICKQFAH